MIELNRIYNERCECTMKKLPDNILDLTVTSPPYDGLRQYNGYSFNIHFICEHLYQITKIGGVCVWVVADQTQNGTETGTSFRQALLFMHYGWLLHDTMIYRKKNYMTTNHRRYEQEFEYMFIFSKGKPKTFNPIMVDCVKSGVSQNWRESGERKVWAPRGKRLTTKGKKQKGNVWEYACGKGGSTNDQIAFQHPAIFQEQLAADHISSWSNEGDLVYDPFSGSATTAKMAWLMNRDFIGSEISNQYWKIGNRRLEPYLQQHNAFRNGQIH